MFCISIMGYNLKNARNGKSMLKIPKWPSLRPPSIKNEILRRSEFLKNKKICMEKVVGEQGLVLQQQFNNYFRTNPLNFLKIQTVA